MIKPEQVQDGGVEVVHVYLVTGHSVGGGATLAIGKATFHSAAGKEHGVAVAVVLAAALAHA